MPECFDSLQKPNNYFINEYEDGSCIVESEDGYYLTKPPHKPRWGDKTFIDESILDINYRFSSLKEAKVALEGYFNKQKVAKLKDTIKERHLYKY